MYQMDSQKIYSESQNNFKFNNFSRLLYKLIIT